MALGLVAAAHPVVLQHGHEDDERALVPRTRLHRERCSKYLSTNNIICSVDAPLCVLPCFEHVRFLAVVAAMAAESEQ